jgi:hypothetical protein
LHSDNMKLKNCWLANLSWLGFWLQFFNYSLLL